MKPDEHARLARLEREYWWHVGRRHILRRVLRDTLRDVTASRSIVDIGCGSGGNVELLGEFGRVVAIDDSPAALALVRAGGHRRIVCGSAVDVPLASESADGIALLDVLEHIDVDGKVLSECHRVLKPGAVLLMTVPAYQWLWSGHDEALGHKRRYTRAQIAARVSAAGFGTRRISYAVCVLFPMIAGFRILERVLSTRQQTSYVMVPAPINALFAALLRLEAVAIAGGMPLPFGTSIVVVGIKPEIDTAQANS